MIDDGNILSDDELINRVADALKRLKDNRHLGIIMGAISEACLDLGCSAQGCTNKNISVFISVCIHPSQEYDVVNFCEIHRYLTHDKNPINNFSVHVKEDIPEIRATTYREI